ncbi:MAG: tetratricopeptide repeat protein, partial [Salinivirgaceae bacterium]|nr:tetratricopeptide repeat protein [Salinivirgaceae bacterium]
MRSRWKRRPNGYRLLKRLPLILTLVVALAATSCSTKKNTAFNRRYQAFTTKYNIYYNGIEHYKETLKDMETKYEDDYSGLVLMHPAEAKNYPKAPQPEGNFTRSIEKAQKAIQLHSLKKRPKRKSGKADAKYKAWLKREEFNPFIHNAWLLMAKSQYMNGDFLGAASTFYYISKHFTWLPETTLEARLWQSRCYSAMEWTYEAENLLVHVKPADLTSKRLVEAYNFAYADYYTKTADKSKAIPYLTAAASMAKGSQKTRLNFLLGQLYALEGNRELAYKAFGVAAGSNSAQYRTKFNARIKQSEVYAGKNIEPEVKSLKRMTHYGRNKEYLDQIYYAIGNLYLSRNDTVHAVENYVLANEKSTRNGIDKAINNITLGGIYFNQHLYDKAQPCYSEAIPQIPETYPNYETLKRRSDVLDELAVYSQNVTLQDSLLRLSAMSEADQLKVVNKIIEELKKKEKEAAEQAQMEDYLANQNAAGNGLNNSGANAPKSFVMNSDNSWYFYNTSVRNAGKTDFQKRWGSRKLEDNWRRRNKSSFDMSDFSDTPEAGDDSLPADSLANADDNRTPEEIKKEKEQLAHEQDPHFPEFYLKQIPKTDEERQTSNDVIQEGLFNMGVILKDKLEDFAAAKTEFDRLLSRYPDNVYRLDVYYNIYLMMMRQGKTREAEKY